MAKQLKFGFGEAAPAVPSTRQNLDLSNGNFALKNAKNDDVFVVNVTTPTDQPETIRFASKDISNIYTGTGIDPAFYATSRRGISVVSELFEVATVTDSDDPSFRIDLPCQVHTVFKVPVSQYLQADDILSLLFRQFALNFQGSDDTAKRIDDLIHGALIPKLR